MLVGDVLSSEVEEFHGCVQDPCALANGRLVLTRLPSDVDVVAVGIESHEWGNISGVVKSKNNRCFAQACRAPTGVNHNLDLDRAAILGVGAAYQPSPGVAVLALNVQGAQRRRGVFGECDVVG